LFNIFFISINFSNKLLELGYESTSLQRNNQYSNSSASFKAIFNLCIKSFLLSAFCDSLTLAPIDVPDLNI